MSTLLERVRSALGHLYDVERELGAGGMGIVFLAREHALGRRPVALKVLRPELATATAAERFRREAETLAAVRHPGIVTIHRVGPEGGLYFFAMELLAGTLAGRLDDGPLAPRDALDLAANLLNGLARVHDAGIVHRDIKPSNIFLRDDGQPVLGDFGIAKTRGHDSGTLTATGHAPFTPNYVAPEQIAGGDVTPRADLYTVGMVLYESLTGRRWFPGTDPARGDWTGVPTRIVPLLHRALDLDPARRWEDARRFAGAIAAVSHRRSESWKATTVLAAIAVTVIGVVLVVANGGRDAIPAPEQSDVAILPFTVDGGGDEIGEILSVWIEQNLRRAFGDSGLAVTPENLSAPWAAAVRAGESLPERAWGDLRTDRVVRGSVGVSGDSLAVRAEMVGRDGTPVPLGRVAGSRHDLEAIGFRLAHAVVGVVRPERASEFVGIRSLGPVGATEALIAAEFAFQRDNWVAAERMYREAIRQDSSLALAWWGLYNARRWQRLPPGFDLAAVYARYAARFDDLERLLIEAELASTVDRRLAVYDSAIRRFPWNAYPRLLRGNELFHRGALVGKGLDSAIAALGSAANANPYFAATYDMLTWAYTRIGNGPEAQSALATRAELGREQPVGGFDVQAVFELAVAMRFLPRERWMPLLREVLNSPDGPGSLVLAVRLGLALGLPDAQLMIGAELAGEPTAAVRVQGLTTQAIALVAAGRPEEGARLLARAAEDSGDGEYAFQAAQWRLVLPTLGLPGIPDSSRTAARATVAALGTGSRRARAAWTLLLDADAQGGPARDYLDTLRAVAPGSALTGVGEMFASAWAGDTTAALALGDSLASLAVQARLEDPLHRAVLYVTRGRLLAANDPVAADAALLWVENADFAEWPQGHPQGAELDWALEPLARYERALLATDPLRRCRLARPALRWWVQADTAFTSIRERLRAWTEGCGDG